MSNYYQPEIETASAEQIREWQNERLVKQIKRVWDNVPYYRKKMEEKGVTADIACMHSGPLGGDAEIAAMVVRKEIDLAVFLIDDLNPQPHEADIQMLLRQCRVHNVPIACNRYSADLMITSTLWDDESYVPTEPKYVYFKRE